MAVKSAQVATNTSTATALISQTTFTNTVGSVGDPLPVVIENHDPTNPVYIGAAAVTSSTGLKIAAGASLAFQFLANDAQTLYGISTGGAVTVGVLLGRQ
jgi:hypothetical protein